VAARSLPMLSVCPRARFFDGEWSLCVDEMPATSQEHKHAAWLAGLIEMNIECLKLTWGGCWELSLAS